MAGQGPARRRAVRLAMIAPAARAPRSTRFAQIDVGDSTSARRCARAREPLTDERDRALLLELVTRHAAHARGAIDYQLAARVKRPLAKLDAAVLDVLRLGAFQLLYLSRLPASAVVNDAVDLTRRGRQDRARPVSSTRCCGAGARTRAADVAGGASDPREHLAVVHSHPRWLVERWLARYGVDAHASVARVQQSAAPRCALRPIARLDHARSARRRARERRRRDAADQPRAHGLDVIDGQRARHARLSRRALSRAGRSLAADRRARRRAAAASACSTCARPLAARRWRSAPRRRTRASIVASRRARRIACALLAAHAGPLPRAPTSRSCTSPTTARCRLRRDVRPRADRRALLGPWHRAPRPRHPLAAHAGRPAALRRGAARSAERAADARAARRRVCLQHLLERARGERRRRRRVSRRARRTSRSARDARRRCRSATACEAFCGAVLDRRRTPSRAPFVGRP